MNWRIPILSKIDWIFLRKITETSWSNLYVWLTERCLQVYKNQQSISLRFWLGHIRGIAQQIDVFHRRADQSIDLVSAGCQILQNSLKLFKVFSESCGAVETKTRDFNAVIFPPLGLIWCSFRIWLSNLSSHECGLPGQRAMLPAECGRCCITKTKILVDGHFSSRAHNCLPGSRHSVMEVCWLAAHKH